MIDLGREICGEIDLALSRDWLVTNGIGGYAMGTIPGAPARCYHGLLIAATIPPVVRTLMLARLDETAHYDGRVYPLYTRLAEGSAPDPAGWTHIERFRLEDTSPVWTFAIADALLERRIWMQRGANRTFVRYSLVRATSPLTLQIEALVHCRDHHAVAPAPVDAPIVASVAGGIRIRFPGAPAPLILQVADATVTPLASWEEPHFLPIEARRGLPDMDAAFRCARFELELHPGTSWTLCASDSDGSVPDPEASPHFLHDRAQHLLSIAPVLAGHAVVAAPAETRDALAQLVLAADQFIVDRPFEGGGAGKSIIAGYPWFTDWGRDTMISLPGLTLATGRYADAAGILRTFARYVSRGMLPNRFPDAGEAPEYNTVDATLWYFEAIRAFEAASARLPNHPDPTLLSELFPLLQEIIAWHRRGTRYGIGVDAADGLLAAGEPGVQLTWMDAKVGDWVVTPRIGKPVEINALWYNALRCMAEFARRLGRDSQTYDDAADRVEASFGRFRSPATGCCCDVIDGPNGDDPAIRPNQLLAVSLAHSPLPAAHARTVVDVCARELLTSHGLRSLSAWHPSYIGRYGGPQLQRDAAYHQGAVWGWLIGPFVSAHYRVYGDAGAALAFTLPLLRQLRSHCLGSISEIFEGDPPHEPRGCIAQAWSVAELLRVWNEISPVESCSQAD